MDAVTRGGDVPAPRVSRIALIVVLILTLTTSLMVTTRRAEAAATGEARPILKTVHTHPRSDHLDPVDDDAIEPDTSDPLPPGLVLRLRVAHAAGELDLFEDVAMEIAYHLVR